MGIYRKYLSRTLPGSPVRMRKHKSRPAGKNAWIVNELIYARLKAIKVDVADGFRSSVNRRGRGKVFKPDGAFFFS